MDNGRMRFRLPGQNRECILRCAAPDDRELLYALKCASVRPYVERIWGWDEGYQREDFDRDFSAIGQFYVVEADGRFAGFLQVSLADPVYHIVEIHLCPEYRGYGIGSGILRLFQELCAHQDRKLRIGCFKENDRARSLYKKLGFVQTEETDTHCILEYESKASAKG